MIRFLIPLLTVVTLFGSCKITGIGFSGGKLPDTIKTVSIAYIETQAALAPPTLSQTFTEKLRDVFQQQTNLTQVERYGDIQLEGRITGYDTRPVAVQGNETAALSRLTVTVSITYVNSQDDSQNFEQSFKRFVDYSSSQNLADIEDSLIEDINDQITQDIFNKVVSDW